ncbi:MAG TPA: UbiD family decarboxylase [Aggregatilineales bacterium]|nr:UbiD family decarboxylase [Aggregatilineales bacterium]
MAYRNLDEYLIRLEQSGELIRISHPVHTDLEISAITQRVQNSKHNRALWFDNVIGHDFPVITNLFGTENRMAWGLGMDKLSQLSDKLKAMVGFNNLQNIGFGGLIAQGMHTLNALRNAIGSNGVQSNTPVQAVQWRESPNIQKLPILRHWDKETAPNIAGATLFVGDKKVIWARAIVHNTNTLGIFSEWDRLDITEPTPAALIIGGDPAMMWSASVPLPNDIPPQWLAGWLRNKPVPFARAISQPINIPSDAEMVIEGILSPPPEIPLYNYFYAFSGYQGAYIHELDPMLFHITAITHRQDAVYPALVPTPSGVEFSHMLKGGEQLLLPIIKTIFPEVCDFRLTEGGNNAIISIKPRPYGYAHKVIYGIWGLGQLALLRQVLVVDESVNIHDNTAVSKAILAHVNPHRDTISVDGLKSRGEIGKKMGMDATTKPADLPEKHGYNSSDGIPFRMTSQTEQLISTNWKHYGLKK